MSTENTTDFEGVEIKKANPLKQWFAAIVTILSLVIALIIFYTIFADGGNFQGGDNNNDPLPGNMFGIIYKGGWVIPIGMSLFLMVIAFSIERFITIGKATGKGSIDVFVKKIRIKLADGEMDGAMEECNLQEGSVANVLRAGLRKYTEVEGETHMDKDQKKMVISQELEEATNLELPMLERNLPIIATIVSIGVLIGLFGTVLGMIKAFSALSAAGAPDSSALATGISEALVNTAMGIANSTAAIIMYNFFTTKIDALTYSIDEAGYSLIQTFDLRHSNNKGE